MSDEKVKGPAAYFPSIEKTYGKPMQYWFDVVEAVKDRKHMEQVQYLKDDHSMGHGHANAIVAYIRSKSLG